MSQVEFSNSLTQLRRAGTEYQNQVELFRRLLDDTRRDMLSANRMWKGQSKEAFVEKMDERLDDLETIYNGLRENAEALQVAVGEYSACEQNISEIIRAGRV